MLPWVDTFYRACACLLHGSPDFPQHTHAILNHRHTMDSHWFLHIQAYPTVTHALPATTTTFTPTHADLYEPNRLALRRSMAEMEGFRISCMHCLPRWDIWLFYWNSWFRRTTSPPNHSRFYQFLPPSPHVATATTTNYHPGLSYTLCTHRLHLYTTPWHGYIALDIKCHTSHTAFCPPAGQGSVLWFLH